MQLTALNLNDQLIHQLSQVIYGCLEELGSTKAALYLVAPDHSEFRLMTHFGWPRALPPPPRLAMNDPLVLMTQREKRCFALNQAGNFPEVQVFVQGKPNPHFFIAPIYDHGDWIGLLVQRDPRGNDPYRQERMQVPTMAICEEVVKVIRTANPPPISQEPHPVAAVEATRVQAEAPIRIPAPPTFPEQRTFFWETARMLFQVVPATAVAMWVFDPMEQRPLLVYSHAPLSPDLEAQVVAQAKAQRPDLQQPDLHCQCKAELPELDLLTAPFCTLLPIMLEEQFGKPDLLMVFRTEDNPFAAQEQEFIQSAARLLGLYLEEGRLHQRYHTSFLSVSHRILASAGSKLPNLRAHSLNTAELSRAMARRLELSSPEVEAVTISAILHDVGTLLLDLKILDKPALTAEDLEKVQTHPILASTFLQGFHFPFDILRIIRHHHERWDGRGYPDSIAGEAIPIESRIIHLVESFQMMTTGTAYRAAKTVPAALAELRLLAGLEYDPRMVEEFIKMLESGQQGA
jgi:hypothetical protein